MNDKANNSIWGNPSTRTEGPVTGNPMIVAGGLLSRSSSFLIFLLPKDRTGSRFWNKAIPKEAVQVTLSVRFAGTGS